MFGKRDLQKSNLALTIIDVAIVHAILTLIIEWILQRSQICIKQEQKRWGSDLPGIALTMFRYLNVNTLRCCNMCSISKHGSPAVEYSASECTEKYLCGR